MIRSIVFFLDHFHLFELNLKNSLDNNFELYHLFCLFEHILSPFLNSLRTISLFFKNKLKSTQHLSIFNFSDRYRNVSTIVSKIIYKDTDRYHPPSSSSITVQDELVRKMLRKTERHGKRDSRRQERTHPIDRTEEHERRQDDFIPHNWPFPRDYYFFIRPRKPRVGGGGGVVEGPDGRKETSTPRNCISRADPPSLPSRNIYEPANWKLAIGPPE